MKTIPIANLKHGVNEMLSMPIGHKFSIIKSKSIEGIEKRTEYKKISETHVEIVRNYEYS